MAGGRTLLRPAAAWLLLALCADARAEGLNAWIEPMYDHLDTRQTDSTGRTTTTVQDIVTQQYRLGFDRTLTDYLSLSLGGNLLDQRGTVGTNGVYADATGRTTDAYGRLTLGTPVLNVSLTADRSEQQAFQSDAIGRAASFVTETYSVYGAWHPIDLPELDLRLARSNQFDSARLARDLTVDNANFTTRYYTPRYDLRYLVDWTRSEDHLTLTDTTSIQQTVLGTRNDRFLDGRVSTYVSATGHMGTSSVETSGLGGLVTKQQLPYSGLSAVETFPSTTTYIALTPNPLVIDGNTTASTGLDVGYGPSAGGDRLLRHVGVGFADALTPVNTIYVWFDRALTPPIASALATSMAVYQSNDNQNWTPVAIVSPPAGSPFANRIEITVTQTQARYLKVTMAPLAVGVTTDAAFRDVFVTEMQVLLVLPASSVPTHQSLRGGLATGTVRALILREPDLAWDGTASVGREAGSYTTYSIVNGLTITQRLARGLIGSARGARVDENLGLTHDGIWQWNAALNWNPVPTALATLNYSGWKKDDGEIQHALTALGRADFYEGVSGQASATVAENKTTDRTVTSFDGSARLSLVPNSALNLSGGIQYQRSFTQSETLGDVFQQFARVDGSLTWLPFPAVSLGGTIARVLLGPIPSTLGTMQVSYFPLRGDLQLSVAYSKTFDTASLVTTESFIPSMRWNFTTWGSLRAAYTYAKNDSPALLVATRAFETSLLITL